MRVVGFKEDVEQFLTVASEQNPQASEFHLLPFLIGLVSGCAIGLIPIPVPGGGHVSIGMPAGAFLISLILSYYGKIGSIRFRVSLGAVNLARELGFGLVSGWSRGNCGSSFVTVFAQVGPAVFLVGLLVTIVTISASVLMLTNWFKLPILVTDGALAGLMTNPPALAAAKTQSMTDMPTLAYATIFPFAMLLKIALIQIILVVLSLRV